MKFFPAKIISVTLLFVFCGALALQAQQPAQPQAQRWLLVFGTSSAMKKRLPAVEAAIKTLFATDFAGKISSGDSIRVWTVGDKLKVGPLVEWSPENVPGLTSNLITFLRKQSFSGSANLSSLEPSVRWVVANSDRVTILIYCDGSEHIDWSPYDGINEMLRQTVSERKKLKQPVLIVLRAQQGKFIEGMVNFPPSPLSIPSFPPLPGEIKAAALANAASNPPPVIVPPAPPKPVAPLVIIGTHISTNAADATNFEPVSPPPVPVIVQTSMKATNQPVAVANPDDRIEKILTFGGGGLLAVAAALVVFLLRRKSSPRGSLITSSMQENFRSKDQK